MIRLFAAALFASTGLTAVNAAELDFNSSVEKVMVFPSAATVTRMARGSVPSGNHVIVIDDLPGNVVADSVRVKGTADGALVQSSVDVRQLTVRDAAQPQERKRIEAAIEALQHEQSGLERKLSDIGLQRNLLQSLAASALKGSGEGAPGIDPENLTGLLDTAGVKLASLQDAEMQALLRQGEIGKEVQQLQISLNELSPKNRVQTVVSINVSAEVDLTSAFEIEYKVNEAGWRPLYDARLSVGDNASSAQLELIRRASVYQRTGENWEGVELSLSTARPSFATSAPELSPFEIDEHVPIAQTRSKTGVGRLNMRLESLSAPSAAEGMQADAVIAATPPVVETEVSGFQAVFRIPGANSVSNTGEVKNVMIDRFDVETDLHVLTVPRHDLSAYLMAAFTHEGETPLLPGKVSLMRGDVFVGSARLPLLAPGESHEIGFGVDDSVEVARVETDKQKGESGFITSVNTDRRQWKMTIDNRHDFAMPVKIRDRMPVSNQEDIEIALTNGTTPPSIRDLEDKRGILEWSRDLEAGEAWEINFGYEVTWPEDMKISQLD